MWCKLDRGWVKLNIDAVIFSTEKRASIGWILRDEKGVVITTGYKYVPSINDPFIAGALSFQEALSWINDKSSFPSHLGLLVNDCRQFKVDIPLLSFVHIKRSVNQAAHFIIRCLFLCQTQLCGSCIYLILFMMH